MSNEWLLEQNFVNNLIEIQNLPVIFLKNVLTQVMRKIVLSFFVGSALWALGVNAYAENIRNWTALNGNLPITQSHAQINALTEFNQGSYIAGSDDNGQAYVYRFNGNMSDPVWSNVGNGLKAQFMSIKTLYTLNNKQLLAGGVTCSSGSCQAVFAGYNGNDNQPQWTLFPTRGLPVWAAISKLITLNGQIIAIVNNDGNSMIDPVYVYDSTNQTWKSISSDLKCYIKDIIIFHNHLYACGGSPLYSGTALYVYDNSKSQWKLVNNGLPNSPSLLSTTAYSLAVFNDTLYVSGQYYYTDGDSMGYVFAYNGNDDQPQWTDQSRGLPFYKGGVYKLIVNNNVLYSSGTGTYGSIFVYTFDGSSWRQFGPAIPQTGYGWPPQTSDLLIYNKALYLSANAANFPVIFGLNLT